MFHFFLPSPSSLCCISACLSYKVSAADRILHFDSYNHSMNQVRQSISDSLVQGHQVNFVVI